jgi:hypothetical protein
VNQDYRGYISDADEYPNPYHPFSTKLDWEVACWAKKRGQGSNALTDLLNIEGVSFCACINLRHDLLI